MKALILAFLLISNVYALPALNGLSALVTEESSSIQVKSQVVFQVCNKPNDLITAANALLKRFFNGQMFNSNLYEDFIWIHPEYVDFISCVICNAGNPNNPYWEVEFTLMCEEIEADIMMVDDHPLEEDESPVI
jgi:hypothetical protein